MSDQELLEMASKAAGHVPHHSYREKTNSLLWISESGFPSTWSPLTDDGDAFRLAAKLGFDLKFGKSGKASLHKDGDWYGTAIGPRCDDPAESMRRAIVKLAASQQDANEVHELVCKKLED